jgi:phosphohistidine phosphatase
MVRLALLRHAKSSWADPGVRDIDRPLNARGQAAAPIMGQVLASLKFVPDCVLCSPSARTRETLGLITPHIGPSAATAVINDDLYLAEPSDILAALRALPENVQAALVIGHNPGLHELACRLAGTGDTTQVMRLTAMFPTAALAVLSFPAATFKSLDPATGYLETFVTPKDRA